MNKQNLMFLTIFVSSVFNYQIAFSASPLDGLKEKLDAFKSAEDRAYQGTLAKFALLDRIFPEDCSNNAQLTDDLKRRVHSIHAERVALAERVDALATLAVSVGVISRDSASVATSSAAETPVVRAVCAECHDPMSKITKCGNCGTPYCSRICQVAAWGKHKAVCNKNLNSASVVKK